ncbi:hypothetical protein C8R43DRAFT_1108790 [Mycena crocata]|nr:hypothetical protein C8R43DRAFT_1108790 [Mycena crocata]
MTRDLVAVRDAINVKFIVLSAKTNKNSVAGCLYCVMVESRNDSNSIKIYLVKRCLGVMWIYLVLLGLAWQKPSSEGDAGDTRMVIQSHPDVPTPLCEQCNHVFEHIHYQLDALLAALRHNYSPEGGEADQIRRAIIDIDEEFKRYDPELSRLQSILSSLQQKRGNLQWYQDCCRGVLSPLRKLPPEILREIFLAGAGSEPDVIPVAGQVCRYWRDVVVGTPKLWSRISIGRRRFSYSQRYGDVASLFLERSANHPLTVCIRNQVDSRLVELLTTHAHRWRVLRLSSQNKDFYSSLGLDACELKSLRKFEITEASTDFTEPENPIVLRRAPKLREVVLKGSLRQWGLPWAQLTRLQYDAHAAADGVGALRLCTQLVECSLDRLKLAMDTEPPLMRPLRHLRVLRLAVDTTTHTSSPENIMKAFFISLTAPDLVSLDVVGQWYPEDVTKFVSRSACELENLSLGMGYMKDEKIIAVLESLPLLKTLVLDADIGTSRQLQNRAITDKLLRRLILYPDSDGLLPSLTHLELKTTRNFEDQVLLDVIESRWIPWVTELYGVRVARLTSVDLHLCGRVETLDPETIEELRDLFAAGLRVSLQQGREIIPLLQSSDA